MAIDTACSSSLVAASLAAHHIQSFAPLGLVNGSGEEDNPRGGGALVGGINLMLLPETTGMFQRAGKYIEGK
jgi:acyl transferase domain-containing protein